MEVYPQTEETTMVLDPQEGQGSNGDAKHNQGGRALPEQTLQQNNSAFQAAPHYLVSHLVPSATGTSGADIIAAQSPTTPSTSGPLSFFVKPPTATPSSGPSSLSDKPSGAQLNHANDGKEQGKPAEIPLEDLGPSNNDIVSVATIEPSLSHGSSTSILGGESTHTVVGVTSIRKGNGMEMTPMVPATILSTAVATESFPAPDHPIIYVQLTTIGSTSPGAVTLGVRPPEKEGGSETPVDPSFLFRQVVSQTPSISSGKADVSMLLSPAAALHPSSEPLSDMDISRASTPPIAVLEAHSGGSNTPDSRSVTPQPRKRVSEAGIELVQAEELEDEMVDELAPLFGKEMKVIHMDRAYDVPGEFTWDFTISRPDWDNVSQWVRAPENLECVHALLSIEIC
jgi:hypothetical protein